MLDTSEDLDVCKTELGCEVEQLLTPGTRFKRQYLERNFAIDNYAFAGFKRPEFDALLWREKEAKELCRFVVVPDVVGSARRTYEVFDSWKYQFAGWRLAFVAQDGQEDLPIPWGSIDAIFIGGTTRFKLSDYAKHIIRAAKSMHKPKWVHIGRVNTPERFDKFEHLEADSIDGTGISRFTHMREAIANRENTLFSRPD